MIPDKEKIHYTKPSITALEIAYVHDAIENGWGEKCYDYVHKFGDAFKQLVGANHAIPTSSCTGAIHIALLSAGVGSGDEVIVPDLTWIASASPVTYVDALPVTVDIKPDTWCIDPTKIEASITPKTKAIIAVHLYGNLCDMDQIMEIADRYGLIVIEDAAEAVGSIYKGKHAGTIGNFGAFSFHGTKTLTTGEGGMLVMKNESDYKVASTIADHGRNPTSKKQFWSERVGVKYRLSNIQAALGLAQTERADKLIGRKREIFSLYAERLGNITGLIMNPNQAETTNSYWMPTIFWDRNFAIKRESLLEHYQRNNIDCRVVFYPISSLPCFPSRPENLVSYDLHDRGINLPSYFEITNKNIDRVCEIFIRHAKL